MKNAHERFGWLEFEKQLKDTRTRLRVALDRFISEPAENKEASGTCHLVSVFGNDVDIGAIWAGFAGPTASLRTAVMRTLMLTDPSPRASRATRQALTVALVKPGRGSSSYHAKNSSSPRLYTRLVMGEETLSSTRRFKRCHWAACGTTIKSVI